MYYGNKARTKQDDMLTPIPLDEKPPIMLKPNSIINGKPWGICKVKIRG